MVEIKGYKFEEGLYYDEDHGWVRDDGELLTFGVTDFFQKLSGEIVFVELPAAGRNIEKGKPYSSIESGKWVGRLKAPLSGEIVEVNNEIGDFPYMVNEDPYGDGWIIKVRPDNKDEELKTLFTINEEFTAFIEGEEKKIKEGNRD
ncbi:MAG: glycine cleavage system H protein [Bacillota bacterium]|nr:glycine cleavage system H protein [Bacillota bacterium]